MITYSFENEIPSKQDLQKLPKLGIEDEYTDISNDSVDPDPKLIIQTLQIFDHNLTCRIGYGLKGYVTIHDSAGVILLGSFPISIKASLRFSTKGKLYTHNGSIKFHNPAAPKDPKLLYKQPYLVWSFNCSELEGNSFKIVYPKGKFKHVFNKDDDNYLNFNFENWPRNDVDLLRLAASGIIPFSYETLRILVSTKLRAKDANFFLSACFNKGDKLNINPFLPQSIIVKALTNQEEKEEELEITSSIPDDEIEELEEKIKGIYDKFGYNYSNN